MKNATAARSVINPFRPEFTIVISSITSRELLSQFSTSSGWRWLKVSEKIEKIAMYSWYWQTSFMEIFILKSFVVRKLSLFSGM